MSNSSDLVLAKNLLIMIKTFKCYLHTFYHDALSPEIPDDTTKYNSSHVMSILKFKQVEECQKDCKRGFDKIMMNIKQLENSSQKILEEISDLQNFKNEKSQESYVRNLVNEKNKKDILAELDAWDKGEVEIDASDITNSNTLIISLQFIPEEWQNQQNIAKHISGVLKLGVTWNELLSRFEVLCENFAVYLYVSDRRKLPIATVLPDQLRLREEHEKMTDIFEQGDEMEEDSDQNENINGETFIRREKLSEFFLDHISVLAHHEDSRYEQISKYGVYRNIQKQLLKATEYYSGKNVYKTFLIQSLIRYIHSYRSLFIKETPERKLLNYHLIPPTRTFNTYMLMNDAE